MLNSTQILEENLLKLENTFGKLAQVGYDLSLKSVEQLSNGMGIVLKDKTILNKYNPIPFSLFDGVNGWILEEGVYNLTFNEGCNIPNNRVAFIKQRSSLYRNGSIINSPVFDPGFKTNNMGTMLFVNEIVFIEENARVAQIYFYECASVENSYNGQFQHDKQRNI